MSNPKQLILITCPAYSHQAKLALEYTKNALKNEQGVHLFFYGDGAYIANRLMWQTADRPNPCQEWVQLATTHNLQLPVCVSTALARGISDQTNAQRHNLDGHNLHPAFNLVGLSELALLLDDVDLVKQF